MKKILYAALALLFCISLTLSSCEKHSTEEVVHSHSQ